jgi:REP element-mobilizing transposase RayT
MAKELIRIYGRGHLHFITFSCYRRVPFLRSVRAKNAFVQILGEVRDRYGFSLVGYVVMPEHDKFRRAPSRARTRCPLASRKKEPPLWRFRS